MVSAYKNPASNEVIIVLVNTSEENVELRLNDPNFKVTQRYLTDNLNELSVQQNLNLVSPKQSIVTFVGSHK
jgi:hypothetical protein